MGGVLVDAIQALAGDVLQPGQQPEAEEVREREPDDGCAVRVDVVAVDPAVVQWRRTPSIIAATSEAEQPFS